MLREHADLIWNFVKESNKIEGIDRLPNASECREFKRFMDLPAVTVDELIKFVSIYQPGAVLRDKYGLDVRVGRHIPPMGDPLMAEWVQTLIDREPNAYELHVQYELLHPFTDCNGRSGRMLWAWKYRDLSLGFLHRFYYQALDQSRKKF